MTYGAGGADDGMSIDVGVGRSVAKERKSNEECGIELLPILLVVDSMRSMEGTALRLIRLSLTDEVVGWAIRCDSLILVGEEAALTCSSRSEAAWRRNRSSVRLVGLDNSVIDSEVVSIRE